MWPRYLKYINKSSRKNKDVLKSLIKKLVLLDLNGLDVKKMKWYKNLFRLREWKIRIIFEKVDWMWKILDINPRWDIYKNF